MSNKNRLYRSGCNPRVIFYSQSSKGHEYNYGNPVITITGRNSRHITQTSSKERKLLDYIRPYPKPNTNRTINPSFGNLDIKDYNKKNKKSKINYGSMDNTFCEKKNKKRKSSIKTCRKKNKTSSDLLCNFKDEKIIKTNTLNKNIYSFYIKNKYDYSSEILNLPGGYKRNINDIQDDYNNEISKKVNMNSTANCFRERNINPPKIECLVQNLKQKINRPYSVSSIKTNYNKCGQNEKLKKYSDLLYSSNSIFYKNNYYNLIKNSNDRIINNNNMLRTKGEVNNNFNKINNKENFINNYQSYNKNIISNNNSKKSIANINKNDYIKDYPFKTEINTNNQDNLGFYQPNNKNKIFPNYFNNVYKEKKNSLITHYAKRKNIALYNKLFNDIHQQENNNYSIMNHYGKNYSKKNYSQIEFHYNY